MLVQHLEPLPEVHDLDDGRPGDHAREYRAAGGLHQGRGGAAAGLGPEQRERRGGPAHGLPEVVGVRGGQLVGDLNSTLYNFRHDKLRFSTNLGGRRDTATVQSIVQSYKLLLMGGAVNVGHPVRAKFVGVRDSHGSKDYANNYLTTFISLSVVLLYLQRQKITFKTKMHVA